jgi:ribonuclease VapC
VSVAAPKAVLDASALVALTFKEPGHEIIRRLIVAGVATTTPTGLAETLTICRRKGYTRTRDELVSDLLELGLGVEPLVRHDGAEMAFLLARSDDIKDPSVGSLSLGDAACLAVAHRLDLPAVMSDSTWEVLDVAGLKIHAFR